MSSYTKTNLRQVEDQAPNFGMPAEMQARFARTPLEGKSLGLSLFTLAPSFRIPFAHKHAHQEEVYVVVRGSARVKVEDEIVELGQWDAIRIDEDTMRAVEAARRESSTSRSAPATIPATPTWSRAGGATEPPGHTA